VICGRRLGRGRSFTTMAPIAGGVRAMLFNMVPVRSRGLPRASLSTR
jgi:hypothetical protein